MSRGVAAAISMVTQPNFADSFVSSISGVAASGKMQVDAAHTPKGRRLRRATPTQRDALDRKRASVPLRGGCARLGFRLRKSFRGARTPEHGLAESTASSIVWRSSSAPIHSNCPRRFGRRFFASTSSPPTMPPAGPQVDDRPGRATRDRQRRAGRGQEGAHGVARLRRERGGLEPHDPGAVHRACTARHKRQLRLPAARPTWPSLNPSVRGCRGASNPSRLRARSPSL